MRLRPSGHPRGGEVGRGMRWAGLKGSEVKLCAKPPSRALSPGSGQLVRGELLVAECEERRKPVPCAGWGFLTVPAAWRGVQELEAFTGK